MYNVYGSVSLIVYQYILIKMATLPARVTQVDTRLTRG